MLNLHLLRCLAKHLLSHKHQRIAHHGLSLFGVFVRTVHPCAIIPKFAVNFRVNVQASLAESALGKVLASLTRMVILTLSPLKSTIGPMFHQAMMEIEDDQKEPGTIIQEIQKGFMIKDRLLRPSLVGVSKKTQTEDKEYSENEQNKENN